MTTPFDPMRGFDGMMLSHKQQLFARLLAQLITFIFTHPSWAVTLGEGFNAQRQGHMADSLHYEKLAQDLNLFVEGHYVTSGHPVWDEIGACWKGMHPLARWGGDFHARDYNHFSLYHEGRM